jgi:hypothetical protein
MKSGQEGQAKTKSASSRNNNNKEESTARTQRKKATAIASRKNIVAVAAPPPSTKQQLKKKSNKVTYNIKTKRKNGHHHQHHYHKQPPFDLFQNPSKPSFTEGFASVISMLQQCKRIVVLTGAGISVSCGIPECVYTKHRPSPPVIAVSFFLTNFSLGIACGCDCYICLYVLV